MRATCKACGSEQLSPHCAVAEVHCSWVKCRECGCVSDALSSDPQDYFSARANRTGQG